MSDDLLDNLIEIARSISDDEKRTALIAMNMPTFRQVDLEWEQRERAAWLRRVQEVSTFPLPIPDGAIKLGFTALYGDYIYIDTTLAYGEFRTMPRP